MFKPGLVIDGAYRLGERIAAGGMGEVYRAHDMRLGRAAAVKVLLGNLARRPASLRRFKREAASVASLQHPNILAVWDYGELDGTPYIVMPFIEGGTLKERLGHGPIPEFELLGYVRQMADALDYAHGQGIVHRDVKPANVLLDKRGHLHLADFGVAKALTDTEKLTEAGGFVGTPEYAAPEQGLGHADARSDLYSLVIILYEMLAGRVPFSDGTPFAVLRQHQTATLPLAPLRGATPGWPQSVERVVQKALAKNPNDRYQSGRQFVDALSEDLARGASTILDADLASARHAQVVVSSEATRRTPWRVPRVALVTVLTMALAAGAVFALTQGGDGQTTTRRMAAAAPTQSPQVRDGAASLVASGSIEAAPSVAAVATMPMTIPAEATIAPTTAPTTAPPTPASPTAAQPAPQVVVTVSTPAPDTRASAPGPGHQPTVPGSPAMLPAEFWTVCVWCDVGSYDPLPEAERMVGQVHAAGFPAAILSSSDYPSLNPGYWVTYSGVFDTGSAANVHSGNLSRAGFSGQVRFVSTRSSPQPIPIESPYWTVILGSFDTKSEAEALAGRLRANGASPRVMYSSGFASLRPGYWITHVGRFSDEAGADREAKRLRSLSFSGAYAREIRR